MSLWWAKREQLDLHQVELIENTPLSGNHLVIGPPGSGKTNVLLRRAQFVRTQNMPNILVLTFTRALTEFVRTGCYTPDGKNIFPEELVTTTESWVRSIYRNHGAGNPPDIENKKERRAAAAAGALSLLDVGQIPKYDAIFVDEAQDLVEAEAALIVAWANNIFLVGDDRQKIYEDSAGLAALKTLIQPLNEHALPFHYRLVREVCEMADRIQTTAGGSSLAATSHYQGPTPGRIKVEGPFTRDEQISQARDVLRDQVRVYADLIAQGDRLGVIVPRQTDRDALYQAFEDDEFLHGKSQIVRARDGSSNDTHTTAIDRERPILILTAQGAKGLEFRSVQWLFSDDLGKYATPEKCYTVVTRAKTSLDIYFTDRMPEQIAKSYSPPASGGIW